MTIFFDHHIVPSTDKARTARFYADILGLPDPREEGPFAALDLGNDVAGDIYASAEYRRAMAPVFTRRALAAAAARA